MAEKRPVIAVRGTFSEEQCLWTFTLEVVTPAGEDAAAGAEKGIQSCTTTFQDEPQAFYDDLRWYVEKYALEMPFEKKKALRISNNIAAFRSRLYDSIAATTVVQELVQADYIEAILEIREGEDPGKHDSIFQIPWETVERVAKRRSPLFTIRRSVPRDASVHSLAPEVPGNLKETLDILVVVGRDFSKSPGSNFDHIMSQPLYEVMDALPDKIRGRILVKLLRPASLQSLRRELEKGDIVYDVVHFNLQGVTSGDIGDKGCKLAFQIAEEVDGANVKWGLDLVDGQEIAQILRKAGVRAAIVNSYEATKQDAGFAKDLIRNGIDIVITSAYKHHLQVSTTFLKKFYEELFEGELDDFSQIVEAARAAVRSKPQRRARSHTTVEVRDWFSPVLYHSEGLDFENILQFKGGISDDHRLEKPLPDAALGTWMYPGLRLQDCKGRQSVILELESIFLCGRFQTISLSGFRGVGKSTLMNHLEAWWPMTGLFEVSICLDVTLHSSQGFEYVKSLFTEKLFAGLNTEDWDEEELIDHILVCKRRILLSVDDYDSCDGVYREKLWNLVGTVSSIPGNLSLLSVSDIDKVEESLGAYNYRLEGLGREAALELAYDVSKKADISRKLTDFSDPSFLETVLGLADNIPMAIMLTVESLGLCDEIHAEHGIQDSPITLERACTSILAGSFLVAAASTTSKICLTYSYLYHLFSDFLSDPEVDGIEKEILALLSHFVSVIPKNIIDTLATDAFELLQEHVECRPEQEITEATEVFDEGEAITSEPEPTSWYYTRCSEAFERLMKRFEKEALVIDDGDVYRIHPLLTRTVRNMVSLDDYGDTGARFRIFAQHHNSFYESMLKANWKAADVVNYLTFNLRNFVASQLAVIFTPNIDECQAAETFFEFLSKDLVFALSRRVVFDDYAEQKPLVKTLWFMIYRQFLVLSDYFGPDDEGNATFLQKATEITAYVVLALIEDKCRAREWNIAKAIPKVEPIINSIIDYHEDVDYKMRLKIVKARIFFGLNDNFDGLKTAIQMHEAIEEEAYRYINVMTPELERVNEESLNRLPRVIEIVRNRAVNRGFLYRLYRLLSKVEPDPHLGTQCAKLRAELAEDWKSAVKLASFLGEPPAYEMKELADWTMASHEAFEDPELEAQLLATIADEDISVQEEEDIEWDANRVVCEAYEKGNYREYLTILFNKRRIAEAVDPVDYLTIAEIEQLTSVMVVQQGYLKEAPAFSNKALAAINNVSTNALQYFPERRAFIALEAAVNAYYARDYMGAEVRVKQAIAFCSHYALSSYPCTVILLQLHFFNQLIIKSRDSQDPKTLRTAIRDHMRASHDFEVDRITSKAYTDGKPTFEDFNLRISDVLPYFFSEYETSTLKASDDLKGQNIRFLTETYLAHRDHPDPTHLQSSLFDLLDSPRKLNPSINTKEFFQVFGRWFEKHQGVLSRHELSLACREAEIVFCWPGKTMKHLKLIVGDDEDDGEDKKGNMKKLTGWFAKKLKLY